MILNSLARYVHYIKYFTSQFLDYTVDYIIVNTICVISKCVSDGMNTGLLATLLRRSISRLPRDKKLSDNTESKWRNHKQTNLNYHRYTFAELLPREDTTLGLGGRGSCSQIWEVGGPHVVTLAVVTGTKS